MLLISYKNQSVNLLRKISFTGFYKKETFVNELSWEEQNIKGMGMNREKVFQKHKQLVMFSKTLHH